jgi:hypothetical protein
MDCALQIADDRGGRILNRISDGGEGGIEFDVIITVGICFYFFLSNRLQFAVCSSILKNSSIMEVLLLGQNMNEENQINPLINKRSTFHRRRRM